MEIIKKIKRRIKQSRSYPKIFCIGRNKTGTTSLEKAFHDLGYWVGDQRRAELLLPHYINKNFEPIIEYCRSARVFQDSPFSYPDTYRYLDKAFPGSRFILTIRDSPEQWYESLIRFHSKVFGHGHMPTAEDLKQAGHVYKGWIWQVNHHLYQTSEQDPYNREILMAHYEKHNRDVMEYFSGRSDLLVINVSKPGSYQAFCDFLGEKSPYTEFPWENRTSVNA